VKLYKYMSRESAIRLLTDGCVRFTQPGDFNDPFELKPSFQLMSKQDLDALPDAPDSPGMKVLTPEAIQSMMASILPGLQKSVANHEGQDGAFALQNNEIAQATLDAEFGVFCLSESADNLLMWAHYADNHRGVCVEIDTSISFFHSAQLGFNLPNNGKVHYLDKRPVLSHSNLRSPNLLFRKSPEWAYEKEWRFIKRLREADRVIDAKPFPIHLFQLPAGTITGIVIGCGVSHADRVEMFERVSSEVTIFQTRLHDERYALEIHPPLNGEPNQEAINGKICVARMSDES
jgi:hypothetical protein